MEGVIFFANQDPLAVQLSKMIRYGPMKCGNAVFHRRGKFADERRRRPWCLGRVVDSGAVVKDDMTQRGRSFNRKRLGGMRDGQEGETATAK